MRFCVVIPHADFLTTAGVRIRYMRMEPALGFSHSSLSVVPIDQVAASDFSSADVFIFSKTYSTLAIILARHMRGLGKLVGFDLFDDYFSQDDDARLVSYRDWLKESGPSFDFILCSTPMLRHLLGRLVPGMPSLVLPDAAPERDLRRVMALARGKVEAARATRTLDMLWFGIGDSPYFSIGLKDLAAYGECFAALRRERWDVRLTILTNPESLNAEALRRLATLPVRYVIEPWSEEAELGALDKTFACFLPVNAQSFSRAKSLNRATSALSSGCQVLSTGYPLYGELAELIYRDPMRFLVDLANGTMSNGGDVKAFAALIEDYANPYANAAALEELVGRLGRARPDEHSSDTRRGVGPSTGRENKLQRKFGIVHGVECDVQAHKAASRLGGLSIKSPLTLAPVNYDVRFDIRPGAPLAVCIRPKLLDLISDRWRDRFNVSVTFGDAPMLALGPESSHLMDLPSYLKGGLETADALPSLVTLYDSVMRSTIAFCHDLLDGCDVYVSDRSKIARWTDAQPSRTVA